MGWIRRHGVPVQKDTNCKRTAGHVKTLMNALLELMIALHSSLVETPLATMSVASVTAPTISDPIFAAAPLRLKAAAMQELTGGILQGLGGRSAQ